ncbi:MAG: type IV pilus assembly protein PilM [Gammaproteobacteria bacterium]|nr:type IV pilus assembly protein PilM [Gammaproteobacteria bacterium]
MGLFSRSSKKLLGIDISSSAVKLVELSRTSVRGQWLYKVEAFATTSIPEGVVESKRINDPGVVGDAIRDVVTRSGTTAKRAATALSGSSIISRVIQLPAGLSESEMEAMVALEADQYIPQHIDEVRYDFDVLGANAVNAESVDVLLAASRGDVVDDLMNALEVGGLIPEVVDAEPYAVEHCCQLLMQDDASASMESNTVIADIGVRAMDVHVLHHGNMVQTREYAIGGSQLTSDIQQAYGLGYDEAERQKCHGSDTAGYEEMVIQPFVKRLTQELRGALQIYQAKDERASIGQVLLVGGCANLPGIAARVEEELALPVKVWDPFAKMQFAKKVDINRLRAQAPGLAVASGLALWGYL